MKILIVGGGIAGTTLAAFLQKDKKFKITLIDQAPKFGTIGFAVALWPNGQQILEQLGLKKSLVDKFGYEMPWEAIENTKGQLIKSFYFSVFKDIGKTIVISRTDLHSALVGLLKRVDIRFGTTVDVIKNSSDGATVTFSDGKIEEFDLVVGADGTHSKVRSLVFGDGFVKYAGWRAWCFWVPSDLAHPRGSYNVLGNGRIYFEYPLFEKAIVMFGVAMPAKLSKEPNPNLLSDLHKVFKGFDESIHKMIDTITDPTHVFNDDINYVELKPWSKQNVVLIGDAQHGISPATGMGASFAMEDAYVLADELIRMKSESLVPVLKSFEARRNPRVKLIKAISKRIDNIFLAKGFASKIRDLTLPIIPTSYFLDPFKKLLKGKI